MPRPYDGEITSRWLVELDWGELERWRGRRF